MLFASNVDLELPDVDGKLHRLSDYRGKWLVINFWASWCTPCITELPELARYQNDHADTTQLLGINYEGLTAQEAKDFLAKIPATGFPHLLIQSDLPNGGIPDQLFVTGSGQQLSLKGLPSTLFLDPEGVVLDMHLGPITYNQLVTQLTKLGATQPVE